MLPEIQFFTYIDFISIILLPKFVMFWDLVINENWFSYKILQDP